MDELEIQKMLEEHEKRISQLEKLLNNKNKKVNTQSNSVYDLIEQLKADDFFDSPKLLKEIVDELDRLGHHYKSTSLTNPIQRMLKNKSIGRIGKKGKWQYVKR